MGTLGFFYPFSLNILKHLYSHPIGGSYSIKIATGTDNNNNKHMNAIALYILLLQFVIQMFEKQTNRERTSVALLVQLLYC